MIRFLRPRPDGTHDVLWVAAHCPEEGAAKPCQRGRQWGNGRAAAITNPAIGNHPMDRRTRSYAACAQWRAGRPRLRSIEIAGLQYRGMSSLVGAETRDA